MVGCKPDEMGVGPAVAIPAALDAAGLSLAQVWSLLGVGMGQGG